MSTYRGAMTPPASYELIDPVVADSVTSERSERVRGGGYIWIVEGTFGGATITLQRQMLDDTTWEDCHDISTALAEMTEPGFMNVVIPEAYRVRVKIDGGTPSLIASELRGYGSPTVMPFGLTIVHIGEVGIASAYEDVLPTLDTSLYQAGDVLFETTLISNAMRKNDTHGVLQNIIVQDDDLQMAPMDLVFLRDNVPIGVTNAEVSITDTQARDILGIIGVGFEDYVNLGGVAVATLRNVDLRVRPSDGTRDIYVAAIARGQGQWTANGLRLRFAFGEMN